MPFRVALLGIYHESNTFVETPTSLEDFKNGHYLEGAAIRNEYQEAHHEIGGMIEVMDREGIELVPVLFAEATPGGTVSEEAYAELLIQMTKGLRGIGRVDACLVVPHGAGVSAAFPDMDGHWLAEVRSILGPDVPLIGTLDLHANVSPLMASSTNALVAYRKNPHVDQRQRGIDAGQLLADTLNKKIKPVQVLAQMPLAISIEQQLTANEPCLSLYRFADEIKAKYKLLSLSILHGFPYADVAEMGTSVIAVADNDQDAARKAAEEVRVYILHNRHDFVGKKISVAEAVAKVPSAEKPALLLDMGDNVGGGGPANNTCLFEALEQNKQIRYFVCIYDAEAVQHASVHPPGDSFMLDIHGLTAAGRKTHCLQVELLKISDGNFSEANPRHGGQVNFRMGKTAVVRTTEGSVIMLTSMRVLPFSLQQLLSCGVDPLVFDAIVAKGVNAPVAAYAPVCNTIIQVNTPGVTQADMTLFDFKHRSKPLFPFEEISNQY